MTNTVMTDVSYSPYLEGIAGNSPQAATGVYTPGKFVFPRNGNAPVSHNFNDTLIFELTFNLVSAIPLVYPTHVIIEDTQTAEGVDKVYAPLERMYLRAIRRGDIIQAWLREDQTISYGDPLRTGLALGVPEGSGGCVGLCDNSEELRNTSFCVALEDKTTPPSSLGRIYVMITK